MNKNTHWIPGTHTHKISNRIPERVVYIKNIISISQILTKTKFKNTEFNIKNINIKYKKQENSNYKINNTNNDSIIGKYQETINNVSISETDNKNNNKQTITDYEGTPFSPKLTTSKHNLVVDLKKDYIYIFSTDV